MSTHDTGGMANFEDSAKNARNAEEIKRYAKRLAQDRKFATTMGQTGTWVNWGELADILGQPFSVTQIPMSKLAQMRRDPLISFGLMFVKVPLIRANWHIESNDPQRAAFVENCLGQIYGRFVLAYTNCFDFGFSPIVKRFEYATPDWTYNDPITGEEKDVWPDKGVKALIWKPFMALDPRKCQPKFNSKGEFAGIDFVPSTTFARGVFNSETGRAADIPLDWSLWATNEKDSEFGSLYGYPRTGYAYRYWWSYWYKFGLSDRAFEKWGDPPFVVFHPSDVGVEGDDGEVIDFGAVALETAEQLRSGANVAMPSSIIRGLTDDRSTNLREWDFKQVESTANFAALNESFEYLDVQKLRAVMVPEQSLVEGKGGSSSRNVAAEFGDIFHESQAVVMEEIDDHINRFMIPQLLEANFGPGGPSCKKVTTGFDPHDMETMRNIVQAIANTRGEIPEVDMQRLLNDLGIPLLSHAAIEAKLQKIAEREDFEYEQRKKEAMLKGHKFDEPEPKSGDSKLAEFSEDEKNVFRRIYDRIFTQPVFEEEIVD